MTLELGGAETISGDQRPEHWRKERSVENSGSGGARRAIGNSGAGANRELPIFDRVLADIGDEQSIAENLSTFSAHMLNLRGMLGAATPRSLVLMDELGTGTAPEEGAALAVALLEEFTQARLLDARNHAP